MKDGVVRASALTTLLRLTRLSCEGVSPQQLSQVPQKKEGRGVVRASALTTPLRLTRLSCEGVSPQQLSRVQRKKEEKRKEAAL